jgi:hypothetical protein
MARAERKGLGIGMGSRIGVSRSIVVAGSIAERAGCARE